MNIQIALSSCPNDTYAFEELLFGTLSQSLPYQLSPYFYDIDALNALALAEAYPIIKVSSALYPSIRKQYRYIRSGAAFASKGGPIIIAKDNAIDLKRDISCLHVATPGLQTSAFQAFCRLYGQPMKVTQMPYHAIAEAVAHQSEYDIGILIHEARTTFQQNFPEKLVSLGDMHEKYNAIMGACMPLGLIIVRRDLPDEIVHSFEKALTSSIEIARKRENVITPFILKHASDLSLEAIINHIHLYVNQDTQYMSRDTEKSLNDFFSWLSLYCSQPLG